MFKKLVLAAALVVAPVSGAFAAGATGEVTNYDFSFEGPFGSFDQFQLQRGLQVYSQVCSSCHGLQYVPIRTLSDKQGLGLDPEAVRIYAAENYEVFDAELDDFRPARPADNFPANVDAGAPDLSLMAKARAGFHGPLGSGINQFFKGMGGPEYITSLLAGYTGEEKEEAGAILYENTAFPGGWISMGPPLWGDDVEFADGTEATIEQQAQDVAAFLMWTAEPKLMARKQAGFAGFIFLSLLSVLLYLTNKKIWAPVKARAKE